MKLSSIDLNLLRVLHVVLEEGSVSRAASRLNLTSSAVSNALRRLREALGDPLFVREGRGIAPTPRALELAPALAQTFGMLDAALASEPFDPLTTERQFTLALSDADQIGGLPALAARFAEGMPQARLRVVSVDTLVSVGGLASPEVDVAVGPAQADGLHASPLYEADAVFVVRRDHPRVGAILDLHTFSSERHVDVHLALGRGGSGHRAAEDAFARHGIVRRVAVKVPSFTAAARVAAATDLLAGIPRRVAVALADGFGLRVVESPPPGLRFSIQMLWHPRTDADPGCSAFREIVGAALGAG